MYQSTEMLIFGRLVDSNLPPSVTNIPENCQENMFAPEQTRRKEEKLHSSTRSRVNRAGECHYDTQDSYTQNKNATGDHRERA